MKAEQNLKRPDIEIKVWMIRNDLSMVKIADTYGAGRAFVSQFIHGLKTSKGLANYMVELGCPAECFNRGRVLANQGEQS